MLIDSSSVGQTTGLFIQDQHCLTSQRDNVDLFVCDAGNPFRLIVLIGLRLWPYVIMYEDKQTLVITLAYPYKQKGTKEP